MESRDSMHVLVADWASGDLDVEHERLGQEGITLSFSGIAGTDSLAEKKAKLMAAIRSTPRIDVLMFCIAPIDAEVIDALPDSCTLLQRMGTGLDNVDLNHAATRGKIVRNTPQYCVEEVAVHAMAMMLALHRQLRATQERLLNGEWSGQTPKPIHRLSTATLGVLGFGRIGRKVGELMRPLVQSVIYYDELSAAEIDWAVRVSFDDVLQRADLVTVHLPLTPEPRHIVNRETIAAMKDTAILINAARGALVDPDALAAALNEGRLGCAGLDVFEPEILPADSPLRTAEHILLTSHTAWYSEDSVQDARIEAIESTIAHLRER